MSTPLDTSIEADAPHAQGPPPEAPPAREDLRAFLASLLSIQCELVGALAGFAYVLAGPTREAGPVASHSRLPTRGREDLERSIEALGPQLERLALELCASRAEPSDGQPAPGHRVELLAAPGRAGFYGVEPRHRVIASPLVSEGQTLGACVIVLAEGGAPRGQRVVTDDEAATLLALTNARFEAYLWRRHAFTEAEQKTKLRETLELLDASQQGENAGTMGALMCHELARRFGCTRVSIGLVKGDRMRLVAISGADRVDPKAEATESIEAAFEECADQDIEILYPAPADGDAAARRVTRAHEALSRKHGPSSMLSLPLRVEGDQVGVVLLERDQRDPFPEAAIPLLRLAAEFIGPALWTRRLADRGVLAVSRDRLRSLGVAITGPRHTAAKLVALALILVVAALLVPIPDRVVSEFEVKAEVSRVVVPPFSGFLESVSAKPSDQVSPGQILAKMDVRDLDLQIAEMEHKRAQLLVQRDEAQTSGKLSEQRVFQAQADEVEASLTLLRDHRARAEIKAPIAGAVRGDLEKLVGAKIDPSTPLLEVVGPGRIATLLVDERRVHRVRVGQRGEVSSKALPGDAIPITVLRLSPMAELVSGKNVFAVEASIDDPKAVESLRPGATGTARLNDGWTTGMSRLFRPLADEVRLRWWW